MIDIKKITRQVTIQRNAILSKIKRLRRDDPFSSVDRSLIVEPGTDAGMLFGHEQAVVFEQRLKSDLKEIEFALRKIKKGTYGKCEKCGQPAVWVCSSCIYDNGGWLCDAHTRKHKCGEEMLLPVVNSPRVGMCGYTGGMEA